MTTTATIVLFTMTTTTTVVVVVELVPPMRGGPKGMLRGSETSPYPSMIVIHHDGSFVYQKYWSSGGSDDAIHTIRGVVDVVKCDIGQTFAVVGRYRMSDDPNVATFHSGDGDFSTTTTTTRIILLVVRVFWDHGLLWL